VTQKSDPAKAEDKQRGVTVKDVATAPIIYFDMAPNFGCNHGIVNVTLSVSRCLATDDGGVARDVVAVAHLRGSINAAMS